MNRVLIQFRAGENQNPVEAYVAVDEILNDRFLRVWFNRYPDADLIVPELLINVDTIASVKPL